MSTRANDSDDPTQAKTSMAATPSILSIPHHTGQVSGRFHI
ncbi:hypothetical protein [Mycobacterium uberis]|nr:hypothetical protein [Mycobacterium uberis]